MVRPTGIEGMKPKSVRKKLKQPSFAAKVDRGQIQRGIDVGDPVLAAVADESTWTSPSSASHREHRERPRRARRLGDGAGSQWAPWIAHGTTCSSRQNVAARSPAGS